MVEFIEKGPEADPAPAGVPDGASRRRALPWHMWIVGVISLLWNCFGVLQYMMAQLHNRAYLEASAQGMGVSFEEMTAFIDSFPGWIHAFWALGVWGALLGSILLLARSRFAVWSFAVSLLGLVVTQAYQAVSPKPDWAETSVTLTAGIWLIAIGLLTYAAFMRRKGVLK